MNRINLICLGVQDLAKSLSFYKNISFQTNTTEDTPPILFFNNQGSKLELYPLQQLAKDICGENPPQKTHGFTGITFACNTKSEHEVDEILKYVELHGGNIIKPAQHVFWGGYSGYFTELDGYYWEVAYSADWKFEANDMLIIE